MKAAILYLRVSTSDQATHNHSLPVQEKKLNDYCFQNDISVAETFIERGESARTDQRPEFQKMLAYCQAQRSRSPTS
jgi:site-specific DNA recombinase